MSTRVLDEHGGARNRKVFALNEFQGHRYFEIEEYYLHRGSGEWRKKKGVSVNKDAYRILREVIARHDEKIMDWIGAGYVPEDVARYEEVQELAVLDNRYRTGALVVDTFAEPRDPRFFDVSHEGGQDRASLNQSHALASHLGKESPHVQKLVGAILSSYGRARTMLAGAPAFSPETLFSHLEQDWGKYLRDYLGR